ncbi:MAG: hypothetical protein OEV51_06595, partial [Nitrospira sp.]|nr:hypothetical protein [Nitrospira sp.]
MQSKDPYFALLGVFILSVTFFFCGKGLVTSPPPAALEHPAEISPPAPNIIEPPSLPPVSALGRAATMSGNWKCWLWTVVGAGLLGWGIKGVVLEPVMDDKRREVDRLKAKVAMLASQPPEVRTVEKRVEVPVERVVVKRVEVPVEKLVDRPIDSPEHLARIKALEGEVAVIAGLFTQIAQLKPLSSQVGERRSEGRVVVPVDNPEHLARIKALEGEVAVIAELRAQIAALQAAFSQAGEKVVEKRVESPADQIVVQNGNVPVETVSAPAGGLDHAGAVEPSDEGQA